MSLTETKIQDTNLINQENKDLDPIECKEAIKRQVEFYFSRANLAYDTFLVSKMNSKMYVPIDVILNFSKIKQLTDDPIIIADAIRDSTICSLNKEENAIKPNIKAERSTIILREICSDTPENEIKKLFSCHDKIESLRSDVGDTWFVSMKSEEDALKALAELRIQAFNNVPIKARLKSENILKSFYPPGENDSINNYSINNIPYNISGMSTNVASSYMPNVQGFFGPANGFYNTPITPLNNTTNNISYGNTRIYNENINRFGNYPSSRYYKYNNNNNNNRHYNKANHHYNNKEQKDKIYGKDKYDKHDKYDKSDKNDKNDFQKKIRKKTNHYSHNYKNEDNYKTYKNKKNYYYSNENTNKEAEKHPLLTSVHFPPLPIDTSLNNNINNLTHIENNKKNKMIIKYKYSHHELMEIIKNMDDKECILPDNKIDYNKHSIAVTKEAHPNLLKNQRTYSIEQAREALRRGRPIRSDSVNSTDYESMMYGEEYTNKARELREKKQNEMKSMYGNTIKTSFSSIISKEIPSKQVVSPNKKNNNNSNNTSINKEYNSQDGHNLKKDLDCTQSDNNNKSYENSDNYDDNDKIVEPQAEPQLKINGYAAALIHGVASPKPIIKDTINKKVENNKSSVNLSVNTETSKQSKSKSNHPSKKIPKNINTNVQSPTTNTNQMDTSLIIVKNEKTFVSPWGTKRSFVDVLKTSNMSKDKTNMNIIKENNIEKSNPIVSQEE